MRRLWKMRYFVVFFMATFLIFGLSNLSQEAFGAQYNLKIPCDQPPDGPNTMAWHVFKQFVESNSGGRIQVKIYPSAQLGDASKILEATKMGVYQVVQGDDSIGGAFGPMSIWQIPYLFPDELVFYEFFKSDVFKEANEKLAREMGLRILGAAPYGFYCFINKKHPVTKLEDLKGLKFRTLPGSEIMIEVYKALGISPTPVSWTEIYTSIKTGVVDGLSHAPVWMEKMKWYEVAKHITLDYSFAGANTYMVNDKWFQSLPADLRQVVQQGINMAANIELGFTTYQNRVTTLNKLKAEGVTITSISPKEKTRIREIAQKAALDLVVQKAGKEAAEKTLSTIKEIEKRLYGN